MFLPSPKSTVPSILPIPLNSIFLPAILLVKSKSFISPFKPTYFLCSGVAEGSFQKPYFLAIPAPFVPSIKTSSSKLNFSNVS
ncbi:MAG: hypothetical protein ACFNPZ_07150 [Fusobacterium polymorphum]